jgi:hypothetical protein
MKVYNENAESLLFERVKELRGAHNSWRCIYFNPSGNKGSVSADVRSHFIISAITELLSDDEGYVYLCDDGDIFILFQGALTPIVKKLARRFDGIRPEKLWEQPEDSLFTIFDLSRYWNIFYKLCQAKFAHAIPA